MLKNGTAPHFIATKEDVVKPIASDDIMEIFGKKVYDERRKQHMTIEQLAEAAGTSDDTIKRIENNRKSVNKNGKAIRKNVPGLDVAYNIAYALGVPMQTLLPARRDDIISHVKSTQAELQLLVEELSKK